MPCGFGDGTNGIGMDEIQDLLDADFEAARAQDVEALLRLRTDDSVSIFMGEPQLVGKDAIRAAWQVHSEFDATFTDRSVEEVVVAGDWAFARYTLNYSETPKSGGEVISCKGRVVCVLRQEPDGTWRIHWEMVNSRDP